MELMELENLRHELLEDLCKEMNDAQVAAVVHKEEGAPEMVSAILDEVGDPELEVRGYFYFRAPDSEDDAAQVFMSVITISDELPEDRLPALYEAISYVNFNIPVGSFSIDKDHKFFCYVLSMLMPMELVEDAIFQEMDLAVGNALSIADSYIGILADVMNGKIDADGVVEFLGGPENGDPDDE